MNKKSIIIIILTLIVLGGLVFIFLSRDKDTISKIPVISNFFPESEEVALPNEETEQKNIKTISKEDRKNLLVLNITEKPVASYTVLGSSTIRFLDKALGHLYETDFNGENAKRTSNTTILNIFDAAWEGKDRALLKFLKDEKDVVFFSANFNGSSTIGIFLDNNTKSAALSHDAAKIAYLVSDRGRGIIFTTDANNTKKQQVLNLPMPNFLVSFKNKNELLLLTAPSAFANGILYSLNLQNKSFNKVSEGQGLTVLLSPDGEKFFASTALNNKVENKIISFEGGEYFLSLKTFPEKCVFSKQNKDELYCAVPLSLLNGNYPDDWYSGKTEMNDALYKINFKTGENRVLLEEINNLKMDIINLSLDPDENYLFFINKKNGILWRVKLPAL